MNLLDNLHLKDVFYVPSFKLSLISVQKLCYKIGTYVHFTNDLCLLQGPSMRRSMLLGRRHQGLYYVHSKKNKIPDNFSHVTAVLKTFSIVFSEDLVKIWHIRLGQMPIGRIKILLPQINVFRFKNSFICSICYKARQERLSFNKSCIKTSKPFEIIQVDVWGPYSFSTCTDVSYDC